MTELLDYQKLTNPQANTLESLVKKANVTLKDLKTTMQIVVGKIQQEAQNETDHKAPAEVDNTAPTGLRSIFKRVRNYIKTTSQANAVSVRMVVIIV